MDFIQSVQIFQRHQHLMHRVSEKKDEEENKKLKRIDLSGREGRHLGGREE